MGCCSSISKTIIVQKINTCSLDALQLENPVSLILKFVDEEFINFESKLLEKIIPTKPRGAVEFERLFQHQICISSQRYMRYFSPVPKISNNLKEYEQYRIYFLSKCRSKEGSYRCLNDFYSFEHNYTLKHHLIKEISSKLLAHEEVITLYIKLAKGTFIIEGLQDVYDFLKLAEISQMKRFVEIKANEVKMIIEANRKQLERAERRAFLPLIFESTLGIGMDDVEDSFLPVSSSESYNYDEKLDIDFQKLYEIDEKSHIQNEFSNSLSPAKLVIRIFGCN